MQPHGHAENLIGDEASYEREGGAAIESAATNEVKRPDLLMTDSEHYDRTFEKF